MNAFDFIKYVPKGINESTFSDFSIIILWYRNTFIYLQKSQEWKNYNKYFMKAFSYEKSIRKQKAEIFWMRENPDILLRQPSQKRVKVLSKLNFRLQNNGLCSNWKWHT